MWASCGQNAGLCAPEAGVPQQQGRPLCDGLDSLGDTRGMSAMQCKAL